MEISTTVRPVLKTDRTRQFTWLFIIACVIVEITVLAVFLVRGCTGAPGAQPTPAASQIGKTEILNRGGSIADPDFSEHNVYFSIRDKSKLFPKLRPADIVLIWDGKPNNICQMW